MNSLPSFIFIDRPASRTNIEWICYCCLSAPTVTRTLENKYIVLSKLSLSHSLQHPFCCLCDVPSQYTHNAGFMLLAVSPVCYFLEHTTPFLAVIGKAFHTKRLCLLCKNFNETALAFLHLWYMEMSPSSKNVMGHSLHQAFSYETFKIWMSHSLHVSPLPKHCSRILHCNTPSCR